MAQKRKTASSDAPSSTAKRTRASAAAAKALVTSDSPSKGTGAAKSKGKPRRSNPEENTEKLARPPTAAVAPKPSQVVSEEADATKESSQNYWLMKAEPETRMENGVDVRFSIDDLRAATAPEPWDGVRNHVAKNNMKAMRKGDLAFFYHSNCKVPGIAGILKIAEEATVDESAFNSKHPYYDPKSSRDKPRWFNVHVTFHTKFPELISLKKLQQLRDEGAPLKDMQLLRQSRLSVNKVSEEEWNYINTLVDT